MGRLRLQSDRCRNEGWQAGGNVFKFLDGGSRRLAAIDPPLLPRILAIVLAVVGTEVSSAAATRIAVFSSFTRGTGFAVARVALVGIAALAAFGCRPFVVTVRTAVGIAFPIAVLITVLAIAAVLPLIALPVAVGVDRPL